MNERYEPKSDFLKALIADEIPLTGSAMAEANLRKLVTMLRDDDRSNRDWATMLLSQAAIDTSEIRAALLAAADDQDDVVRAEAMLGLVTRDKSLALPFVLRALLGDHACMAVFEAAELLADPTLVEPLRPWTEPSDNDFLDQLARKALVACERGAG